MANAQKYPTSEKRSDIVEAARRFLSFMTYADRYRRVRGLAP